MKLKKRVATIMGLILLLTGTSFTLNQKKYEIKTVVIDPGHGGHDVGCLGSSAKEKDIALDVSLKLGKLIQDNYPNVKVIFTRKTDEFVELHERAEIANRNKADLFICIHANSGGNAYGTETFVLGLHRAEENLSVSRRENSAILMEKDYKTQYEGFDPNSAEANIIFRLYQSTYLQQSLLFAAKVQDQLNDYAGRLNRGVKQAGLLVLARTTMPGVLIETGFLTNREEEKYLLTSKGQTQIATAIYRAFKEYKIDMEEVPENSKPDFFKGDTTPPVISKQPKDAELKADQHHDNKNKKTAINTEKKEEKTITNISDTVPAKKTSDKITINEKTSEVKPAVEKTKETEPSEKVEVPAKNVKQNQAKPTPDTVAVEPAREKKMIIKEKEKPVEPDKNDVFFTIQLGAVMKPTSGDRERYKGVENLKERLAEDGMTRFTSGTFFSLDKAIQAQQEMRKKGFKDAFVTAYSKNTRITVKEASNLINQKK